MILNLCLAIVNLIQLGSQGNAVNGEGSAVSGDNVGGC